MSEIVNDFFIHNNTVYNVSEFDKIYFEQYPSIYEVIRIIDRIPLFLEDHYKRLKKSAEIIGFNLESLGITFNDIKQNIEKMVEINRIINNNIKLVINNLNINNADYYYFFIKSSYPSDDMYKNGVKTCLFSAVRENPNAKIINSDLRKKINNILYEKNCYEALLVNNNDEITEGSRSNVFFIKNGTLYTSPISNVLPGITRQKIIYLCLKNKIDVIENSIKVKDINKFEAAFLSGTSPKVLPVSYIENIEFNTSNSLLLELIDKYNKEITEYISRYK